MQSKQKKFILNLKTIYLLFLMAIISLITLVMAIKIRNDLYHEIEEGFNQKLSAISLVLSSFINGDTHNSLLKSRDIRHLAYDNSEDRIYGFDHGDQDLVAIHPEKGIITKNIPLENSVLSAFAYDSEHDRLFAIDTDSSTPQLIAIDKKTETIDHRVPLSQWFHALAYHSGESRLYGINNTIASIDVNSATITSFMNLDLGESTGLAYIPTNNLLYFINHDNHLIAIDPATSKVHSNTALSLISSPILSSLDQEEEPEQNFNGFPLNEEEFQQAMQFERIRYSGNTDWIKETRQNVEEITKTILLRTDAFSQEDLPPMEELTLQGLTWDPSRNRLYSDANVLISIDPETGQCWQQGWWKEYRNQIDPDYLDYVLPMRRIKQKLNITYLYTFTHPHDSSADAIVYILDASMDEDHTPIGSPDSFPEGQGVDIYGKIYMGGIYQSKVIEWEDWGLIKTCYAPIYDSNHEVVGVAAADVDVSIISSKTRMALLKTILIGVVAIVLAGLLAYGITLTLLRPILALKEKTLTVAAGNYGEKVPLQGPAEIQSLCHAFNQLSQTLEQFFKEKIRSNIILTNKSTVRKLEHFLTPEHSTTFESEAPYEAVQFALHNHGIDISGREYIFDRSMIWTGTYSGESLNAKRIQQEIKLFSYQMLESRRDFDSLLPIMRHLHPENVHAFSLFNNNNSHLYYYTHSKPSVGFLIDKDHRQELLYEHRFSHTLLPRQILFLGSRTLVREAIHSLPIHDLLAEDPKKIQTILHEWKQTWVDMGTNVGNEDNHIIVFMRTK